MQVDYILGNVWQNRTWPRTQQAVQAVERLGTAVRTRGLVTLSNQNHPGNHPPFATIRKDMEGRNLHPIPSFLNQKTSDVTLPLPYSIYQQL